MKLAFVHTLLPAATFLFTGLVLQANTLTPGGTVSPDVFTVSTPPLLGDTTGTFNFDSGALTGSYEAAVLVDPFGITCAGCLDFAYRISLDPNLSHPIFNLNLARYVGFTTDVGYVSGSGDVAPDSVNRIDAIHGGIVGFFFGNSANPLLFPGERSDFLVVATDATAYDTSGGVTIFAGRSPDIVSGTINGLFEPTVVPEPSTVLLVSIALGAMVVLGKVRMPHSRGVAERKFRTVSG
jgi:hypothetical protein